MGSFAFLALLGFAAIGLISAGDDPEPEIEPQPPEPPEPPLPPEPIGQTLGSDGNDSLDTPDSNTEPRFYDLMNGADNVGAGGGDDTILALGDGSDTLDGGDGNDLIFAGDEGATIFDFNGDDTIVGGLGGNGIYDQEGANLIFGNDGDDQIYASGDSTITTGDGVDDIRLYIDAPSAAAGVVTDFDPDQDLLDDIYLEVQDGASGTVEFRDLEDGTGVGIYFDDILLSTVYGATAADLADTDIQIGTNGGTYVGTANADDIEASDMAETINAGDGDDQIAGGFNLNTGPDHLFGEDGNDTIIARGVSDIVYDGEDGGTGTIQQPNLMDGGAGDDVLISTHANIMTGGEGDDNFVIRRWTGTTEAVEITDFDPADDVLTLYDPNAPSGGSFDGVNIAVWADGLGADVMVGNALVARVTGGQALTPADIIIATQDPLNTL